MRDVILDGAVVEYLNANGARDDALNMPLVALTIRPDPKNSWRPINICITKASAIRLIEDLKRSLQSPLCQD